jgi:hypothetical protein
MCFSFLFVCVCVFPLISRSGESKLKNLCAFVPLDSHELACRFMCVEKLEGLFIQCPITICSKSFF